MTTDKEDSGPHNTVYTRDPELGPSETLTNVQQRLLLDLADLLNGIIDRGELLLTIMARAAEALDVDGTAIILLEAGVPEDMEPDLIFHLATGEQAEKLQQFKLRWGEGYAGEAARCRQIIISNNVSSSSRHAKRVDSVTGFKSRAVLAVPLILRDRVVGVLEAVNKRNGEPFDEDDATFCQAIGNHVVMAIERARLMEKNVSAQRLAAIGETIAGASHCIKNIVNALRGGAYILERGLKDRDLDKAESGWRMLDRSVSRISDLSLDMLTYSKPRTPECVDADLNLMLRDIHDMFDESAAARGVKIVCAEQNPLKAHVDPSAIHRCLVNILSNAVDACADGAGSRVELSGHISRDGISISVSDDGPGISPENQSRLFRPFFSTKGSKGTGLGLSVTRKIVEEHGGTLSVSSTPGEGATFTITLP